MVKRAQWGVGDAGAQRLSGRLVESVNDCLRWPSFLLVLLLCATVGTVGAQQALAQTASETADIANAETDADEDDPFAPVQLLELTAADIENFLIIRPRIIEIVTQAALADDGATAAPILADPEVVNALERTSTEGGFASFDRVNRIEATLAQYYSAIDPVTREFIDPRDTLQAQIDTVRADATLDDAAKDDFAFIYEDMLSTLPALDNMTNRKLVTEYYDRILAVLSAPQ